MVTRGSSDYDMDANVAEASINGADLLITNPPWAISMLHPIISHLVSLRPTWLLLYSEWLFTKQAVPYQPWIRQVVTMPRVIWIDGTKNGGFDNCAWIRFETGASDFLVSGWN